MQVYPNRLVNQLKQQLPHYVLIFGEEPQQKLDALDKVRQSANIQGFTERLSFVADKQFQWQSLIDAFQTMSLFAQQQLIELEIPTGKPGIEGAKVLLEASKNPNRDILLVVHGGKIGKDVQKTKWFKSLDKEGIYVPCYVPEGNRLAQWMSEQLQSVGLQSSQELVNFFCDYFEGNLMAAKQEMEKLKLLFPGGVVQKSDLSGLVAEQSRFNVFQLTDAILMGDAQRTVKLLNRLENEGVEPTIINWALVKEWQILNSLFQARQARMPTDRVFSEFRVWKSKQSVYLNACSRLDVNGLNQIRDKLTEFDFAIKSANIYRPYVELSHLCLLFMPMALSGIPLSYM